MQHPLQLITDIIVQTLNPEKIFLLGTITTRSYGESIFTGRTIQWEARPSCDILVLMPATEQRSPHELQDLVETQCHPVAPVTALVQSIRQFNEWLSVGQPFARRVYLSAKLLHNTNSVSLKTPPTFDPFAIEAFLRQEFQQSLQQSRELLAAAVVQLLQGHARQAASSVRQSAEQALRGCILWVTGLPVNTHSIDKLYRYSRMFSEELATLFPGDTEKETRLFSLLHKAYIHRGYGDDYRIDETELEILMHRIRRLQMIAEKLLAKSYHR